MEKAKSSDSTFEAKRLQQEAKRTSQVIEALKK